MFGEIFAIGKRKKQSICLKRCVEKQQMHRTFRRDSSLSNLSTWIMFEKYMTWFLTLTGCKNFTVLDAFPDSLPMPSNSQNFVPIFHDIMHESDISWPIHQKKWCAILSQWTPISKISSECLHNFLLSEETKTKSVVYIYIIQLEGEY